MKKVLSVLLIALLILSAAACTPNAEPAAPDAEPAAQESPAADPAQWKILGDIWAFESDGYGSEENRYVRIFKADGVYYRAETDIPQDVAEKLDAIDFFDETREAQEKELMKDLPIQTICNLSEVLLSQSELDALIGKTGQELLDMGFVPQGSFSTLEKVFCASLDKGPFEYEIEFEEIAEVDDNPNVAAVIRPLTVKSAAFSSLSQYCLEMEFDINGGRSLADYEAEFAGD